MPRQISKRWNSWTPLLFFILLIAGILLGFQLNTWLGFKRPINTVIERNDRLEEIINLIGERYVDSISTDSLYEDAITGILKHLDPHTVYIPAREMAAVTEDLEGNFKGIGIEFFIVQDTIMITSVIKNGPAQDAGLKTGDRIIRVDSTLVAGTGITNESITKMLRGKADSRVQLTLLHPGSRNPVLIDVKRDIIPIYSIDAAYMVDSAIGYIRINRFSATTYREFMQALRNLQKRGLRELILDLRQNPGGYLDAATAIADEFIGNDRLLVYTQGRATPKEEYKADKPGAFETGHLAVLVDESSASASEILAGAIQDWDRGVIIGQRTYGKGLVQEQYELGDGSALRLTIARYYTPTGRCIQRSYDKGRYAYEMDYYNRFLQQHTGGMQQPDSIKDHKKYFTERNHREVYGGGGILPDVVVPYNDPYISGPMYRLLSETVFNQTIYQYFSGHNNEFKDYASFSSFETSYSVSPELMALLKANYEKNFPDDVRYVWSDAAALHDLTFRVKALLARILFGNAGFFRMLNENDKVMARALSILKTPEYSKIMTGQSR